MKERLKETKQKQKNNDNNNNKINGISIKKKPRK